jgi:acetolactate synthase-1/3 small subunit
VVSPARDGRYARMNIVASGDPDILEQIIKQLEKLIDVIKVTDHTGDNTVEKELALIKVRCLPEERTNLLQLLNHFKAMTVDMTQDSLIAQVTGNTEKIDALKTLCEDFEIIEYVRTGKIIMARGNEQST